MTGIGEALIGGGLIGLAATALMALNGRILGVSGIVQGLTPPLAADWTWRLAFALGVIAAPLVAAALGLAPRVEIAAGPAGLAVAGFIVGLGVVTGSGCTSGHGVCGLSRLSPRSMVATAVFMTTAALTVFVVRHVI